MLTKKITSLQHPLVKHWGELRKSRTYRKETQRLLLMGEKTIRELSLRIPLQILITREETEGIKAAEHYLVSNEILRKITGLNHLDGFAAEVSLPLPQDISQKKFILILDRLSDPGNLGTLFRTALALNWEGVIVTPNTVDLFNDKALRAAKGATFLLPYAEMESEEILAWSHKNHISLYTADLEGLPLNQAQFTPPLALILSHEGEGVRSWTEGTSQKIFIPMNARAESLNVAVSGAILLYTMRNFP